MGLVPLLLFLGAGLLSPFFLRARKKTEQTEAVNNARQIQISLESFFVKYGSYPNAATIPSVIRDTGTTLTLGTKSSNDYLRQLIACGADERFFYSGTKRFRRSDERIDGGEALKKGEGGFAYVVASGEIDGSNPPVLIAPVIPGTKRFDPKPFDGKVVMLRNDGSATSWTLRKDGKIALGGGKFFDPAQPTWNGKPLSIAWPE